MIYKLNKKQFVYTLLKYKKTESKLIRLSPEVREVIKLVSKENNETKFIHKAIIDYIFRNGLRLIEENGKRYFRTETSKPYAKGKCRNCWFVKNWN